jgi:hypothetical protein
MNVGPHGQADGIDFGPASPAERTEEPAVEQVMERVRAAMANWSEPGWLRILALKFRSRESTSQRASLNRRGEQRERHPSTHPHDTG